MSNMHQHDIDHEVERRRAEFNLEVLHENERERIKHRLGALLALIVIGVAVIIFGVALP
jgi:hypothetical protein